VAADALVLKLRENGRAVGVHTLIATGVNAEGYRESWACRSPRPKLARLVGVFSRPRRPRPVRGSRGHQRGTPGVVAAIGATLPGAARERCPIHYTTNLMSVTPKSSWPWCEPCCIPSSTSPTPNRLSPNKTGSLTRWPTNCPTSPKSSTPPAPSCWPLPPSPNRSGVKSGRTTLKSDSIKRSAAVPTSSASLPTAAPSSVWSATS
jgi:putative transposase